jgi:hypothetical protein
MKNGKFWLNLFLILVGVVVGSLFSSLTKDVSWLSWLSYGLQFGMTSPLALNLGILSLTFSASIDLNVSVIIFVVLALLLGRLLGEK